MKRKIFRIAALTLAGAIVPLVAHAQSVQERYAALLARQETVLALVRETPPDAPAATRDGVLTQGRRVIAGYDALVRRFHGSGYADNALFNAATIADALYDRFRRGADLRSSERYYKRLTTEYPTSSLSRRVQTATRASRAVDADTSAPASLAVSAVPAPVSATQPSAAASATLVGVERTVMGDTVRIALSLDREVAYHEERLAGPARVFFDLKDVRAVPELKDVVLRYPQDAVRQIRIGRHPNSTVRVVLDLVGVKKYSVFTMYNPFRVVVDCETDGAATAASTAPLPSSAAAIATSAAAPLTTPAAAPAAISAPSGRRAPAIPPAPTSPATPTAAAAPAALATPTTLAAPAALATPTTLAAPAALAAPVVPAPPATPRSNVAGGFSLSRQLGLGVARVVIDPGHGGHDPGAQGKQLNEADLTLDVALRLEKLLQQDGLEVVLTRRENVYIPLEERTAIANRENADLFLSIHANASRNDAAQGVETYFLSFASSPEAEAVAARENSASSGGMHDLPDIIKAIALNNKLDESRDFAGMVQEAMVSRLRRSNKTVRNLGVKKAPFVVLIGASMPSVLAEISFLTNRQELQLLKTSAYKQRVAEALHASVLRYRRSLKGQGQVAEQ
jgi:N-acetylmuramoyl-L-alanine amidase